MGTITKTFKETTWWYGSQGTWTIKVSANNMTATGETFAFTPTATAKVVGTGRTKGYADISSLRFGTASFSTSTAEFFHLWRAKSETMMDYVAFVSGTEYALSKNPSSRELHTSYFFNESNPTDRTASIYVYLYAPGQSGIYLTSTNSAYDNQGYYEKNMSGSHESWGSVATVTLDVPPTFKVVDSGGTETTQLSFDTPYVYAGLTTASVSVSNLAAYYGGDISSVALTIGTQTDVRSNSGELSIELSQPGTFTPTVTVTDSRGQTKTVNLDPITVNQYADPTVTIQDLDRTDTSWAEADEGENAVLQASFWSDVPSVIDAPSVAINDEDGVPVTTATVSWYTDRARTTQISDWSTVTKNTSVYAFIGTSVFDPNKTYSISVTPNDSLGESGATITATLATAFFTMDFLAGGHGIAFGQPSTQVGFECNMPSTFHDTVICEDTLSGTDIDASGDISGNNLKLELDTTAVSGDDKDIYDALVALGWDSDVIV